jgi:anti-anti-sigma factor
MRPGPGFKVARNDKGGVVTIAVTGDVEGLTAPQLRAALSDVLHGSAGPVVIDLTRVPYLDSTGAAVLLYYARRLMQADRMFAIVCPAGAALQALELMRLSDDLHVVPDAAAARAIVTGASPPPGSWFVASRADPDK